MASDLDVVVVQPSESKWKIKFASFWTLAFAIKALFDLTTLTLLLISKNFISDPDAAKFHSYGLQSVKMFFRNFGWYFEPLRIFTLFMEKHPGLFEICLGLELLSSFLATIIFVIMRRTLAGDEDRRSPVFPALFQHRHLSNPFHYLMAVVVVIEVLLVCLYYHGARKLWMKIPLFWIIPLGAYVHMIRFKFPDSRQVICYSDTQIAGWTVVDQIKPGTVKLSQIA